jgi:hypothetical protein
MPPVYDDVAYFNDALMRVNVFRAEGLRSVIAGLISSPPHAPYSTLAAFAGFLVSGGDRAAPYVMNALAVAALTLFWLVMFRVGPLSAWLITVAITATGWFDNAVTIFHPDLIAGYAAAIVASLAIFQHQVLNTTRRRLVAGTVAGLVLLIKPTALAMALILWGVAFVAGMLASRAMDVTLLASLRRYFIPFLLIIVIAGPYFAEVLPSLIPTYYHGYVSQRSTWIRLSAGANPWTFYMLRTAELFGIWLYLVAAAFAIVAIAARCRRAPLVCLGGLLACLVTAYIVPSLSYLQVLVFGGVLYGMVLVTGFISVTGATIFPTLSGRMSPNSRTVSATLLLIAVGIVATLEMKDRQLRFPPDVIRKSSGEYDRIYSILRETTVRPGVELSSSRRISAYFPTVGVPPDAYAFRGLEEGIDIHADYGMMETDPDRVLNSARKADVVIIPDGRLLTKYFPYPVNAILGDVVQRLRKDTTVVESPPVELLDGAMFIFRRRPDGIPTTVSVTPSSGSAASQTFALQYSDTAGVASLQSVWAYFTPSSSGSSRNLCLVLYYPGPNQINLLNDDQKTWQTATPGASAMLRNSQCSLNVAATTVVRNGNMLMLNPAMSFRPTFAGAKNILMYAADVSGSNSGWYQRGAWTVP